MHVGPAGPFAPRENGVAQGAVFSGARSPRFGIADRSSPRAALVRRCSELKDLFERHFDFCASYQRFILLAPPSLFRPDFSLQYARFTSAFGLFSKQLSIALATPQRIAVNTPTSPLFVKGRSVFIEWGEFLDEVNVISEQGMAPHVSALNHHFTVLFSGMNRCLDVITASNFRSDRPLECWSDLRLLVVQLRDACADVFFSRDGPRLEQLRPGAFQTVVLCATRLLLDLFDRQLRGAAAGGRSLLRLKAEMAPSLAALAPVMRSVASFDAALADLKRRVLDLNAELSRVHGRFGLPFGLALVLEPRHRPGGTSPSD
jgi:hypothetical protein